MQLGLTYDLKTEYVFKVGDPPDADAKFDHPNTLQAITDALTSLGHEVVRIGNAEDLIKSWEPFRQISFLTSLRLRGLIEKPIGELTKR